MGRLTVTQLMQQIAATVNQDAEAPQAGGTEWTLWLAFINRAMQEWSESTEWEDLRQIYYPSITGTGNYSIPLPQDFKRLAGYPRMFDGTATGSSTFPVILPEEIDRYDKTTDKFSWVFGNAGDGFSLQWNPATLASGASVQIPYFSTPTSLASPNDIPKLSDSQFLVDRTIAYVFEARSDPRFQEQEQKAREKLLQMVDYNSLNKYNSFGGNSYVTNTATKSGFRFGRD